MRSERTLVGVDGCRGGWIVCAHRPPGEAAEIRVVASFEAVLAAFDPDAIVAVDMPIGLPQRITGPGREAEKAARPFLWSRRSSLFSMPARAVVESHPLVFFDEAHRRDAHAQASSLARTLSDPPKGVSIQGFSLFPKILEIDRVLRERSELTRRVFESHPEMAFYAMNDGAPCEHPKKVGNRPNAAGLEERRALLLTAGIAGSDTERVPAGASYDDLLDALAMLVVAERLASGTATAYPDPPHHDEHGLPIAIWA